MAEPVILLVEDNQDDVMLTVRTFKKNSISTRLVVANDGVEALNYLFAEGTHSGRDSEDLPQVILLDLKLPKIDGLEVLRRIRGDERTHLLPVVILTSAAEESDLIDGYRLGANSYVCKPVDFEQFLELARQPGLYWLALNQPFRRGSDTRLAG